MLEHKGLYWSKIKGTEDAKTIDPSKDYKLPFGKGRIVIKAAKEKIESGESLCIITYGMGVYWAKNAIKDYKGQVEIIDLRTLFPLDEDLIFQTVKKHGKTLLITEEPYNNSFMQALSGRIQKSCFYLLDIPVEVIGSENLPAIPLNSTLEATMLPNSEKIGIKIQEMLKM